MAAPSIGTVPNDDDAEPTAARGVSMPSWLTRAPRSVSGWKHLRSLVFSSPERQDTSAAGSFLV